MLVAYYGVDAAKEELRLTVISEYLGQYTDVQRKALFNKAISAFVPTSTNTFPIVVHFHSYMHTEADTAREAAEAWRQLAMKSNRYCSIAIEDPRISYALDRIGGWLAFCARTTEGEVFMRNDFLRAFAMAKDSVFENIPKKYRGELDNADKRIMYLGNEENIKAALIEHERSPVMVAFDKAATSLSAGCLSE